MQIQKTNTNFQGIKFPSRVNTNELGKIKEFISNENNVSLIKKLDARETDIYFTEGLKKVGFAHQRYGHLDKHGASEVPAANFSSNIDQTLQTVSKAIKKVQQAWRNAYEHTRGC